MLLCLGYDDSTVDNDISVIRLAGEVVYSDYISPACLPGENEDVAVNTSCWITGWGDTQDGGLNLLSVLFSLAQTVTFAESIFHQVASYRNQKFDAK